MIAQNPIVIKKIAAASPEVTYKTGERGNNIDAIEEGAKGAGGALKKLFGK